MNTLKIKDILKSLVGLVINEDVIFNLLKENNLEVFKEDVRMAVIEVTLNDRHYFTGKVMVSDVIITCGLDYKKQEFYLKDIR